MLNYKRDSVTLEIITTVSYIGFLTFSTSGKYHMHFDQKTLNSNPVSTTYNCVNIYKWLNLSESPFPHLKGTAAIRISQNNSCRAFGTLPGPQEILN